MFKKASEGNLYMRERVLLIDDCRDEGSPEIMRRVDVIARNYDEGIIQLQMNGPWDLVLLDHDLHSYDGDGKEYTGYDIICMLEEFTDLLPKEIKCISSNPPGRARIETVIKKLYDL